MPEAGYSPPDASPRKNIQTRLRQKAPLMAITASDLRVGMNIASMEGRENSGLVLPILESIVGWREEFAVALTALVQNTHHLAIGRCYRMPICRCQLRR